MGKTKAPGVDTGLWVAGDDGRLLPVYAAKSGGGRCSQCGGEIAPRMRVIRIRAREMVGEPGRAQTQLDRELGVVQVGAGLVRHIGECCLPSLRRARKTKDAALEALRQVKPEGARQFAVEPVLPGFEDPAFADGPDAVSAERGVS